MNILNFITPSEYFFYLNNEKDSVIFVLKKGEYYNTIAFTKKSYNYYVNELSLKYNTEIPDFYVWQKLTNKAHIKKFYSEYIKFIIESFNDNSILETTTFASPIIIDTIKNVDKNMNYISKNDFKNKLNNDGFIHITKGKNTLLKFYEIFIVVCFVLFLLIAGIILPLAGRTLPSIFNSKNSASSNNSNINNSNNNNTNNNNTNNNNSNNNNSNNNNTNNNNSNNNSKKNNKNNK